MKMRNRIRPGLAIFALAACMFADAQTAPSIPAELVARKESFPAGLDKLAGERAKLLVTPLESVTFDKKVVAPSGNPHDYISVGIYWWPDPGKPDGLPYIRHDGVTNPEAFRNDSGKLSRMASAVRDIALLYHFTGDEQLAAHGVELLRTFFTDPRTAMNPHLTYAQSVPGREDGRPLGIIDTYILIDLVNSIALLKNAAAMTEEDRRALKEWFGAYTDWLCSDRMRKAFAGSLNNIAVAYHAQIAAYAVFCGRGELAREHLGILEKMIPVFIRDDGVLPFEVTRTKSWDYSVYALDILFSAAATARTLGMDWTSENTIQGRRIRGAVDYLCGYIGRESDWPYRQLHGPIAVNNLGSVLRRLYYFTQDDKYRRFYRKLESPRSPRMTALFYPEP